MLNFVCGATPKEYIFFAHEKAWKCVGKCFWKVREKLWMLSTNFREPFLCAYLKQRTVFPILETNVLCGSLPEGRVWASTGS